MKPLGLAELRFRLRGAKWKWFKENRTITLRHVQYSSTFGSHMGRPCLAVIAQDQFVNIHYVGNSAQPEDGLWGVKIKPTNPRGIKDLFRGEEFALSNQVPKYIIPPREGHETDTDV